MNISKKLLLSAILGLGFMSMSAQEVEVEENVFQPHWYIQGQFGGQETLGETSFSKLLSPNAQVALGYKFNPYVGLRVAVNGWMSKASQTFFDTKYRWKWNYIAPTVDFTADLTNILGGYNPNRLVSVGVFGGIGANVAYHNDEANRVNAALATASGLSNPLELIWSGTKTRFVGQFGANLDFNVSSHVAIGLELQANVLPDSYNSKKAGNADWYFNGLVGVTYKFGKTNRKVTRTVGTPCPPCDPVVVEKVVEKVVEVPVEVVVEKPVQIDSIRRDIFFNISNDIVSKTELPKVEEVAQFLKSHPNSKVVITGYADKGTGNLSINLRLAERRAQAVVNSLKNKYGIAADRITAKSMGEELYQPYNTPEQNRVAICVVE
jgi:outer membrane protein OmpA-like peptidoglycan-associated protein